MHAFIDESKRGEYALCAVTVASGDLTALRKQMNALRPPGHTRIHMTSVGKKLAPKIVSDVARLEANSRLYLMSSKKVNERQARDATLAAAVRDLAQMAVTNLTIETCDQDREDNRIIRDELGGQAPFRYTHDRPTNSLLWLPDVHAWAWGRGGSMRAKIAHRITVVRI
ncbi:hypothetical protein [Rhodococcus koreensis]|uniref:DUF3800 domain-containing protein n=1 Tax=Rhodococcus koreensis TaxID=99653 RepID=A0A1H5F224_9NOCA|nr:hypothetical protein [Rhodococcus koreensis]SED97487.1 hypothetical protein SAMN04490239_9471 [Rhodococcus koreensis]